VSRSRDSGAGAGTGTGTGADDVGDDVGDEDFLFLFLFAAEVVLLVKRADTTTKIEKNLMVV